MNFASRLISAVLLVTVVGGTCRDEDNKPVDWFVAYKLPQEKGNANKNVAEGVGYLFITSDLLASGWKLSSRSANASDSIMGYTLAPLYNNEVSSIARILYNDEPPSGNATLNKGHTKGVVLADSKGGIWLVHSVPLYPPEVSSSYSYPKTGTRYGQSFLCISLSVEQMNAVGKQLMYNEPSVYDSYFPAHLKTQFPTLALAAEGAHINHPPWYNSVSITSLSGESFVSYAKSSKFGKDLYADWLAADLETDLLVQSWSNGAGRLPSECKKPFRVENIEKLVIMDVMKFTTHKDHSKWAAAQNNTLPWVCVGDVNRMEHQEKRGGGTVCLKNLLLWKAYNETVASLDVCPL